MGTYEAVIASHYIINKDGSNHDKVYQNFVMCYPFFQSPWHSFEKLSNFYSKLHLDLYQDLAQLQILSFTFH